MSHTVVGFHMQIKSLLMHISSAKLVSLLMKQCVTPHHLPDKNVFPCCLKTCGESFVCSLLWNVVIWLSNQHASAPNVKHGHWIIHCRYLVCNFLYLLMLSIVFAWRTFLTRHPCGCAQVSQIPQRPEPCRCLSGYPGRGQNINEVGLKNCGAT